jgi:hypothetical protein
MMTFFVHFFPVAHSCFTSFLSIMGVVHADVDKPASTHIESPGIANSIITAVQPAQDATLSQELPKSLWKNLWVYRHASIICILAAVGALSDGYQVQMSGSIIALDGFIRTFGDIQQNGTYVVNPQYISLWGGRFFAMVSMFESYLTFRSA